MSGLNRTGYVLYESARMQSQVIRHHPILPIATVVQPAVFLLILIARGVGDRSHVGGTLTAVLLTSLWGCTLWTSGGILRREIAEGTFARSVTSVTDARLVILGKCLGSTMLAVAILTFTCGVFAAVLRVPIHPGEVPALLLGLSVAAVSGMALGYLLSNVFVWTQHATHVTAALSYPVYVLAGLIIPTSMLPAFLRPASAAISLHWAQRFLAGVLAGRFSPLDLGLTAALTVGYLAAGSYLFRRVMDRARRIGTLDLG